MKELTNKLIKDLKILDDNLYSCRITIQMGAKPSVKIKLEDILGAKAIKVWNRVFPKRKSPEVEVFGDLKIAYNKVVHQKEDLYKKYAISFGTYKNVIPGSNLEKFLQDYREKVVGTAQRELNRIKGIYQQRLEEYLDDIRTTLKETSVVSEQKILQYEKQFPSLEKIEKFFGPVKDGPYPISSIQDVAKLDLRLKSVIRENQLEKTKIAQLFAKQQEYWNISSEQAVYDQEVLERTRQVGDAIWEKIAEIKIDALTNLKYHLQTIEKKKSLTTSKKQTLKDVAEIKATLASVQRLEELFGKGYQDISIKIEEMLEANDPSLAYEIILLIEAESYITENLEFHAA